MDDQEFAEFGTTEEEFDRMGNPEEEPRFEHHLYRRAVPPGHESPLWLYQYLHPRDDCPEGTRDATAPPHA